MNYILYAPEYIITLLVILILAIYIKSFGLFLTSVIIGILLLLFFRGWNKPSNIKIKDNYLYSPCNGIVKKVEDLGDRWRIIVFLNVHNIHVQYSPCKCIVKEITHHKGTFHPAFLLEKSIHNERTEYILYNSVFGYIGVVQIAGQVARRIVPLVENGNTLDVLDPLGLIKLGSRCDIIVTKNINELRVKPGSSINIGDVIAIK
jgi:phosphatidylserine decarboxylase